MKGEMDFYEKLSKYFSVAGICLLFALALWFGFSEGLAAGKYFFNH